MNRQIRGVTLQFDDRKSATLRETSGEVPRYRNSGRLTGRYFMAGPLTGSRRFIYANAEEHDEQWKILWEQWKSGRSSSVARRPTSSCSTRKRHTDAHDLPRSFLRSLVLSHLHPAGSHWPHVFNGVSPGTWQIFYISQCHLYQNQYKKIYINIFVSIVISIYAVAYIYTPTSFGGCICTNVPLVIYFLINPVRQEVGETIKQTNLH